MKILKFPLGQMQANCYFLIKNNECLIIDPADDASFILEELQRRRLKLIGMLATHGHFDHVMAVGEIQQSLNTPLYINKKDQFLLDRLEETAEHFLGYKQIILPIKKTENLDIEEFSASWRMKIISTAGHTPGSQSYYFPKEKIVFTGDTLFKGAIGRFDHSYCNKTDLKNSLVELTNLPEDIKVYSGHGEETTIGKEKNSLPLFLQYFK